MPTKCCKGKEQVVWDGQCGEERACKMCFISKKDWGNVCQQPNKEFKAFSSKMISRS